MIFSVESVEHLRQSGRIGRSASLIAEALQLKPLLRIDEGQIVPYERVRTSARAIVELSELVRELPAIERCAVLYATKRSDADRLLEAIAAETGLAPPRLTVQRIGEAVASQVGEVASSAKEQVKTFASEVETMTRRNPLGAIGATLLVGVVIGMMSRGRS